MEIELTEREVDTLQDLYDRSHLKPDVYWPLFVNKAVELLLAKGVLKNE